MLRILKKLWVHIWLFLSILWFYKAFNTDIAEYESSMAALCMFLLWMNSVEKARSHE